MFAGRKFQRRHGLGSILAGFVRRLVLPFFQTNAKSEVAEVLSGIFYIDLTHVWYSRQ